MEKKSYLLLDKMLQACMSIKKLFLNTLNVHLKTYMGMLSMFSS